MHCFYSTDYGATFQNHSISIAGQWSLLAMSADGSTVVIGQTIGDAYPLAIYQVQGDGNEVFAPVFRYLTNLTWANVSGNVIQEIHIGDSTGQVLTLLCGSVVFYSNDAGMVFCCFADCFY
jgi:hypothetical protein